MSKAPKLRFKEFSGEWEEKKLGELSNLITKGTTPSSIGFQFTNEGINFIKTENIDKNGYIRIDETPKISQECNEKLSRSILNEGDILFSIAGTLGRTCLIEKEHLPANTNQALAIVRLTESVSNKYLNSYLNLDKIKRYIDISVSVGAQPNINLQQVADIKVNIPSKEEQEKIASFLSLIDDKISLQGEKVEALKDYKKGIMQNIFSRELRFKDDEGRDYPEWEERKIKDIFIVTRGVVIAKTEISESKDDKNKYPVYSSQTTNNGILGYDSSYDFEGDYLTWTTDGANAGKVFRRNGKFRCTNVCGVLVEKQETLGFANKMISEILNKETPKHVSYVGNPKLMNGVMGDIKIKVPILDEQIKISKVLDNIDLKIEKEQEKLDCLNEYKKGLLQQMFV